MPAVTSRRRLAVSGSVLAGAVAGCLSRPGQSADPTAGTPSGTLDTPETESTPTATAREAPTATATREPIPLHEACETPTPSDRDTATPETRERREQGQAPPVSFRRAITVIHSDCCDCLPVRPSAVGQSIRY